jgi:hypothetical protein
MGLNRQGKRLERKKLLKEAKYHKKEFYNILSELEYIKSLMKVSKVILTEENIEEEVAKVSGIKLGAMEKMILLNSNDDGGTKD